MTELESTMPSRAADVWHPAAFVLSLHPCIGASESLGAASSLASLGAAMPQSQTVELPHRTMQEPRF